MKLREMYQEEREHHGVRASVLAVARRTGKSAEEVAEKLGLPPALMSEHALLIQPTPRLRCDVCLESRDGVVIRARASTTRFCDGCLNDLRALLAE